MNAETYTADALEAMRTVQFTASNGDRAGASNFALVITDGVHTAESDDPVPVAEAAMADGVRVSAGYHTGTCSKLASTPCVQVYSYYIIV